MKITRQGTIQVLAFILLTLLATGLLVAAGLSEEDTSPIHRADVRPVPAQPG
ncbi:hypothetical protein WKW80_29205 [Variovorax humicola]|uniref:Uncharacterized protein n=1 Tax=Variovorax humicola TaxID=1769758 RepID=A0ABU8W7S5_9BURK